MLIISSSTDYYDNIASSGTDKTIRYDRQTTTLKACSPFHLKHLPRYLMGGYLGFLSFADRKRQDMQSAFNSPSCDLKVIGFCGTYLVTVHMDDKYYIGESILELDWSTRKRHQQSTTRQTIADCIQKFHNKVDHTLFQEFKVPVFVVPITEVSNLENSVTEIKI